MNTPNNNKICSVFLDYSTQQGCFGFGINNHYNLSFLQISGALTAYKICCSAFMPLIYIPDFIQAEVGKSLHQFQLLPYLHSLKPLYT